VGCRRILLIAFVRSFHRRCTSHQSVRRKSTRTEELEYPDAHIWGGSSSARFCFTPQDSYASCAPNSQTSLSNSIERAAMTNNGSQPGDFNLTVYQAFQRFRRSTTFETKAGIQMAVECFSKLEESSMSKSGKMGSSFQAQSETFFDPGKCVAARDTLFSCKKSVKKASVAAMGDGH